MSTNSPFANPEVVSRYEDWYSKPYGAVVDRIERTLLLELLQPLEPGASLLEVGCGTGHFAAALTEAGFRVAGVDPEEAMLAIARARVPVARADGLHLPFQDGAFDGAFLVSVLEFTADPVALLREARRVARRRVVVLALASDSWLGLRRRVSGWLGHPIFARAVFRSRGRLLTLAKEAGAAPERTRSALFLPPALAGRLASVERRLASRSLPLGGVLGLTLAGSAAGLLAPTRGDH
jgi:ubiquinone/menaquinone biosynthesis C-methylase UbiE